MIATLSIPIWGDWSIVRIIHVDDEPFILEITKEIIQSFDREPKFHVPKVEDN